MSLRATFAGFSRASLAVVCRLNSTKFVCAVTRQLGCIDRCGRVQSEVPQGGRSSRFVRRRS